MNTKTDITEKLEIKIPFAGFYNSNLDSMIDYEIESIFDYDGTGSPDIPEDFYIKADYSGVFKAIAREYVEYAQEKLNEFLNLENPIQLEFHDLVSPREYNFTTDRLFAGISQIDVLRLGSIASPKILERLIAERFTSRDGFMSFYQNTLKDNGQEYKESWNKPFTAWDHNQLEILLIAAILTRLESADSWDSESKYFQDYVSFDDSPFIESMSCNGTLSEIIYNELPESCVQLMNDYYEQERARES